jgi:fucose permease
VASVGFAIFWGAGSALVGKTGLFISGLGVASMYPLILSLAIGAAGDKTIQASARATLASGVAILALPLVLGRLADGVGIHLAYGVVVLLLIGVLTITHLANGLSPAPAIAGE